MADTFNTEQRSQIMRLVKSKKNKSTELKLIKFFKENKIIGWRRNYPLFGKPDFVFPQSKTVIFVDGCFWHGHDCRNTKPQTNKNYWEQKISRNRKRDLDVNEFLNKRGWNVVRIWECQMKNSGYLEILFKAILNQ